MNGETLWEKTITELASLAEEIHTKKGLWFKASFYDGKLYVDKAIENEPSSVLSKRRVISKRDYLFVYSFYDRWVSGEAGIRQKVVTRSRNSAYIFALIKRFKAE